MLCPTCKGKLKVIETYPAPEGQQVRRRECAKGHQFDTIEMIDSSIPSVRHAIGKLDRHAVSATSPQSSR
jgi:transcriptional regulator NrdR family protein